MGKKTDSPQVKGYIDVFRGHFHIRVDANRKSNSIGVVNNGDKIPYLGRIKNGWFKVLYNDQIGWLYCGAGKLIEETIEYITVTNGNWAVRTTPSSFSKKIGNVHKGDKLVQLGLETETWQQVEFEGKEGWVTKKAFKINN